MTFAIADLLIAQAGPDLVPNVWRTLTGLVVVLGLLGGLAWLLRRGVLAKRTNGALSVETALPLGDRRSLVIVAVEGRRLLIGLSQNHVALVTELQTATVAVTAPPPSFAQAMSRATGEERRS
jgi:flagellar protein FliO/FliZ